jgi:hypothetical protein
MTVASASEPVTANGERRAGGLRVLVEVRTPTERALVADWARAEHPGAAGAAMRS